MLRHAAGTVAAQARRAPCRGHAAALAGAPAPQLPPAVLAPSPWRPLALDGLLAQTPPAGRRGLATQAGDEEDGSTDLERAVTEQQKVLFPRLREIEEARLQQDLSLRGATVPSEEWSPRQLPYKVYEKRTSAADSDSDSDDSDSETEGKTSTGASTQSSGSPGRPAVEAADGSAPTAPTQPAATAASTVEEVDGVQVGIEDFELEEGLQVGMQMSVEEKGFTYKGPEPTLYGDWQHKGRATDF